MVVFRGCSSKKSGQLLWKNKKRVAIRLADENPKRDLKMSSCRSADYLPTLVLLLTVGHVTLGRHNDDVIVLFHFFVLMPLKWKRYYFSCLNIIYFIWLLKIMECTLIGRLIFLTNFTREQKSVSILYLYYLIICLPTPTFFLVLYFWKKHC